jgi:hypothetical protein
VALEGGADRRAHAAQQREIDLLDEVERRRVRVVRAAFDDEAGGLAGAQQQRQQHGLEHRVVLPAEPIAKR